MTLLRRKSILVTALFGALVAPLHAQLDFNLAGRRVQVHSFASQGFAYSNQNNYLTMKTSEGSFAMTDAGLNISMPLTDRLRVGAQVYVRDFGNLGKWHPRLDWAFGDYRVADWFGIRVGQVKTALGLLNDTQDNDSLHTFALLPQAVYPTDLRDATISHLGADAYGTIGMKKAGSVAYTLYAGRRRDSQYGGYLYLLRDRGIFMNSYGGLQYGGDVKWTTPIKGLLAGYSHMREEIRGHGLGSCGPAVPVNCAFWNTAYKGQYEEHSKKDQTNFVYGEYTIGNLRLDVENRRYWRDQIVWNNSYEVIANTKGWYASGSYRLSKYLELGGYYSRFTATWKRGTAAWLLDTSLPDHHVYDKVVTARVDLNRFWNVKLEGHFMDGYGGSQSPIGFYTADNPQGIKPQTNMFLMRTGVTF
jgi:hypothetical protein